MTEATCCQQLFAVTKSPSMVNTHHARLTSGPHACWLFTLLAFSSRGSSFTTIWSLNVGEGSIEPLLRVNSSSIPSYLPFNDVRILHVIATAARVLIGRRTTAVR